VCVNACECVNVCECVSVCAFPTCGLPQTVTVCRSISGSLFTCTDFFYTYLLMDIIFFYKGQFCACLARLELLARATYRTCGLLRTFTAHRSLVWVSFHMQGLFWKPLLCVSVEISFFLSLGLFCVYIARLELLAQAACRSLLPPADSKST